MKKNIATVAFLLGLSAAVPTLRAGHEPGHPEKAEQMEKWNEKRVERLTEKLSLTPEQQKSLKAVFDEQAAKHGKTMKETDEKINALLTPEQKTKFEKMKSERKEKMKERREHRKELKKK